MMARRLVVAAALLLLALLGTAAAATAQEPAPAGPGVTTVAEILADPAAFAGREVVVRGELVGDFGKRRDGTVWAQLNGDAYAEKPLLSGGSLAGANLGIGVRFPAGLWPGFDQPGGYRARGPVVELTGEWRYHDAERGGESYLQVSGVVLLQEPLALEEGVRWLPLGVGLGLFGAAAVLGAALRRRR